MIAIVLILVVGTWLFVQVVFEQVKEADQISGSDSYKDILEDK